MPRSLRLSSADFGRLQKSASKRIHGGLFTLTIYSLPDGMKGPKMATVVSKKVAVRAVARNSIERRCREVIRKYLRNMSAQYAYVFTAKREAASASFDEIQHDIRTLFEREALQGTMHTT